MEKTENKWANRIQMPLANGYFATCRSLRFVSAPLDLIVFIQILNVDRQFVAARSIRELIKDFDQFTQEMGEADVGFDLEPGDENKDYFHSRLGSKQRPQMLANIVQDHQADCAFKDFETKLNTFLNTFFSLHNIRLPNDKPIALTSFENVRENFFATKSPSKD